MFWRFPRGLGLVALSLPIISPNAATRWGGALGPGYSHVVFSPLKTTKIGCGPIYVKPSLRKEVVGPRNVCMKSSALLKSEAQKHNLIFLSFLSMVLVILTSKQ